MTWVLYVAGRPVASGAAVGDPDQTAVDVLAARGTHPRQLNAQVEVTVNGLVVAAADSRDW